MTLYLKILKPISEEDWPYVSFTLEMRVVSQTSSCRHFLWQEYVSFLMPSQSRSVGIEEATLKAPFNRPCCMSTKGCYFHVVLVPHEVFDMVGWCSCRLHKEQWGMKASGSWHHIWRMLSDPLRTNKESQGMWTGEESSCFFTNKASKQCCLLHFLWQESLGFLYQLVALCHGMLNVMVAGGEVSHDCFDLG